MKMTPTTLDRKARKKWLTCPALAIVLALLLVLSSLPVYAGEQQTEQTETPTVTQDAGSESAQSETSSEQNEPLTEDLEMNCDCVFEEECVLCYSDNPMINNSSVGFQYDSHCKSITRLRNNLIIGIPESTIRFGFTGHDPCYASSRTEHSFNGPQALSDYNYPIICSTVGQQEDNTYGILVMLHELSHLYGVIVHHDPDLNHRCVVERSDNNPTRYQYNDPEDPNTIWCPRCIDTIRTNGNNY